MRSSSYRREKNMQRSAQEQLCRTTTKASYHKITQSDQLGIRCAFCPESNLSSIVVRKGVGVGAEDVYQRLQPQRARQQRPHQQQQVDPMARVPPSAASPEHRRRHCCEACRAGHGTVSSPPFHCFRLLLSPLTFPFWELHLVHVTVSFSWLHRTEPVQSMTLASSVCWGSDAHSHPSC